MNLTTEQRAAVESDARETLVIAGAGSGKTRVLTARVARLLEQGADPSSLMALTFTRKSARELKERLADVHTGDMMLGTFHAVALRILRRDGARLGYNVDRLTVIDEHDADVLLYSIAAELGYWNGQTWKSGYSLLRFTRFREAAYTGRAEPDDEDAWRVVRLYAARLHNMNLLDYGAILVECRRLLREHPTVLGQWRERVKHVLVDELQDADGVQFDIHDFFAPPATFFGVGDTRQSIYKWRGGRPDLMFERHPEATIFNLTECFRCGERIVEAANASIAVNDEPHTVPIRSATGRTGAVQADVCQFAELASLIRDTLRHYQPSDIAVLARSRRMLHQFSAALREIDVDNYIVGDHFEAWESERFRELYAALRLVANHGDDLAFLAIAPVLGLSPMRVAQARKLAVQDRVSLFDCAAAGYGLWMMGLAHEQTLVEQIALSLWGGDGVELNWPQRDAIMWWSDICALGIREGLDWFAGREPQDDKPPDGAVTLTTIHSAKGLEWPVVFVIGCNEGTFPNKMSVRDDEVSEERRCFYVAVTRAREAVHLHSLPDEPPSRFMAEAYRDRRVSPRPKDAAINGELDCTPKG